MANLFRISEAASIGIHAMVCLGTFPDTRLQAQQVAEKLDVSATHLAKVLQRLARSGLLVSTRGPKGGFVLIRPPRRISLLEVFEAIEGPLKEKDCLLGRPFCKNDGSSCALVELSRSVDNQSRDFLNRTKVSDLVSRVAGNGDLTGPGRKSAKK